VPACRGQVPKKLVDAGCLSIHPKKKRERGGDEAQRHGRLQRKKNRRWNYAGEGGGKRDLQHDSTYRLSYTKGGEKKREAKLSAR